MSLLYSLGLKHVPGAELLVVALGFVLRAIGGAVATHVPPSGVVPDRVQSRRADGGDRQAVHRAVCARGQGGRTPAGDALVPVLDCCATGSELLRS